VHWPTLVAELQQHAGLSLRDIGYAINVSHTTVNDWLRPVVRPGRKPRPALPSYEDGKALVELHRLLKPVIDVELAKHHAAHVVRRAEQSTLRTNRTTQETHHG